jgi:hypothetical protein
MSTNKTSLKIVNIEPEAAHKHPPVKHWVLPQHEFSMLIVAPKGSGKTNFICNLLLNHYKEYFHEVWICSPTVENDEKWDVVRTTKHILKRNLPLERILNKKLAKDPKKLPKIVFKNEMTREAEDKVAKETFTGQMDDEDFFSNLDEVPERVADQQRIITYLRKKDYGQKSKYIANRILVVLDDQAGMFKGGNTNNPLVNYVIKHRHSSTSLIIVTQAYKAIPKTIRTNCNALILFEIPNMSELKVIYEENPDNLPEDEWLKVYRHATKDPFDFLYMNNKFKKGQRLFKNFDTMLTIASQSKTLKPRVHALLERDESNQVRDLETNEDGVHQLPVKG